MFQDVHARDERRIRRDRFHPPRPESTACECRSKRHGALVENVDERVVRQQILEERIHVAGDEQLVGCADRDAATASTASTEGEIVLRTRRARAASRRRTKRSARRRRTVRFAATARETANSVGRKDREERAVADREAVDRKAVEHHPRRDRERREREREPADAGGRATRSRRRRRSATKIEVTKLSASDSYCLMKKRSKRRHSGGRSGLRNESIRVMYSPCSLRRASRYAGAAGRRDRAAECTLTTIAPTQRGEDDVAPGGAFARYHVASSPARIRSEVLRTDSGRERQQRGADQVRIRVAASAEQQRDGEDDQRRATGRR